RRKRLAFDVAQPLEQPAGLPAVIGPYRVKGALKWTARESVLLAEDPGLGRGALLWLRPAAMPAIDEARRALSRTTRLRWLAAGPHGERGGAACPRPPGWAGRAGRGGEGPGGGEGAPPLGEKLRGGGVVGGEEHERRVSRCLARGGAKRRGGVVLPAPPLTAE